MTEWIRHKNLYLNLFDFYLFRLSEDAAILLQLIHDLQGALLTDLESLLRDSRFTQLPSLLRELETMELIRSEEGFWECTWGGDGVANWRQQLAWAQVCYPDEPVPEPRASENGSDLGPPCQDFRATYFAPGYCWCCRIRFDHSSEVIRAAERLLRKASANPD